jgi:hypothetical protein
MTSPRPRDPRGAVTAELALGLPVLMAVTVGLVWLLSVGAAQVRTVDAVRETARAVARGDDEGAAVAVGDRVAPDGVRLSVASADGRVVVSASGHVPGPGGIFGVLPGADVSAEAVAVAEAEP